MQRPQPAKGRIGQIEIEHGIGQLRGDDDADQKSGNAPKHRGNRGEFDRAQLVIGFSVDHLRGQFGGALVIAVEDRKDRRNRGRGKQIGMKGIGRCIGLGCHQ